MRKSLLFIIILIITTACLNRGVVKEEEGPKDFELWLLDAQELSNKGKFQKAADLLKEAQSLFGDDELITITYNIGFNYYMLRNFDESKVYLNRVISLFENSNYSQAQIMDYRKFIVLSNTLLLKMEEDIENRKDPYHIKEDIKNKKKVKAKKR